MGRRLDRNFSKKTFGWLTNVKKCSVSLIIREIQIKIKMKYHLIPARMAEISNSDDKRRLKSLFLNIAHPDFI